MIIAIWLALGAGLTFLALRYWLQPDAETHLGVMSAQWMSEQRAAEGHHRFR